VLSLVGGKWTTFRALAAEATDAALAALGLRRRIETTFVPIGGGRDFPATPQASAAWIARIVAAYGVAPKRAATLLERYGTRAEALLASDCGPDESLVHLPDYGSRELRAVARLEHVMTLEDVVVRRLPIAVAGQLSNAVASEIAGHVAGALGWSEAERERQLTALRRVARERHGIDLERGRSGERMPDRA